MIESLTQQELEHWDERFPLVIVEPPNWSRETFVDGSLNIAFLIGGIWKKEDFFLLASLILEKRVYYNRK